MKITLKISIIICLIITSCASKSKTPLTAEVNVINESKNKTIELRSIGYGPNEAAAAYDSERKTFEIILFRGIPETSVQKPLVDSNEQQILNKHPEYFKTFFEQRYKSFIMSVYNSSPPSKFKGNHTVVRDIKINLISLKKDLEDNNIIRGFGF